MNTESKTCDDLMTHDDLIAMAEARADYMEFTGCLICDIHDE